jgi:type IV pilus assembly protein PilE
MKRSIQSCRGFTLIELMIVVAIIGILAAIAGPSYLESVRKSRRADAQSALLQLAQFMERTNTLSNTYKPGGADPALPFTQTPSGASPFYNLSITSSTPTTFNLSAEPIAGTSQATDKCGTLGIDNLGSKTPSDPGCW